MYMRKQRYKRLFLVPNIIGVLQPSSLTSSTKYCRRHALVTITIRLPIRILFDSTAVPVPIDC